MRQKIISALSLVILFAVVFSTQVAATATANQPTGPITTPITSPITLPITSPITSPIAFFQISGHITYKFFKFFKKNSSRFDPAPGVKVEAKNIFTNKKYATVTDGDGNYILSVAEKGVYLVNPSNGSTNVWVPPVHVVNVKNAGSKNNVNFQGFVFP